jgi:hypothetical protein
VPTDRQTPRVKAPGPFGRARSQSLGVLALAMSVAVVIFGIFILPHDAPAAPRLQPVAQNKSTGHKGKATNPASVVAPGATTTTTTPLLQTTTTLQAVTQESRATSDPESTVTTPPVTPTATTSTTTTQAPMYVSPHVGTESWPGNLDDPYTSASYQLSTTGGEVSASATWSGTPTLSLEVTCAGATNTQSGPSGLYVSVDATAGSCTITLAEPAGTEASVSYTLVANYPTS